MARLHDSCFIAAITCTQGSLEHFVDLQATLDGKEWLRKPKSLSKILGPAQLAALVRLMTLPVTTINTATISEWCCLTRHLQHVMLLPQV